MVVRALPSSRSAGREFSDLIDLEPIKHSSLDRLDQISCLGPGSSLRIHSKSNSHAPGHVVEFSSLQPVSSGGTNQRARAKPLAAQDWIRR